MSEKRLEMTGKLMEHFNKQPRLGVISTLFILLLALMAPASGQQNAEGWLSMQGPNIALSLIDKGLALGDQGKFDEAIKAVDEAIKLDPNYAYAWNSRASFSIIRVSTMRPSKALMRPSSWTPIMPMPGTSKASFSGTRGQLSMIRILALMARKSMMRL